MSKRDLEAELWKVYDAVGSIADAAERADRQLKALDLVVKIRSAGAKVKPDWQEAPVDKALEFARREVNGEVSQR